MAKHFITKKDLHEFYLKIAPHLVSDNSEVVNNSDLATVATTGDYTDLSNTPSIPSNVSDLNNDSGFITSSDVPSIDDLVDFDNAPTEDSDNLVKSGAIYSYINTMIHEAVTTFY